jgi:hypothetical protein
MKKTPKDLIRKLITTFYSLGIAVHLLVIIKVIPYTWVNGGVSESYENQLTQSVTSIVIIAILFGFTRRIASRDAVPKRWQYGALYVIVAFWLIGFIMQILGTSFERYIMSVILLLGVASHILLIRNIRLDRR